MKRDLIYPQGSRTMNEETRGELCKQLVLAGYTVRLITIKDEKGRLSCYYAGDGGRTTTFEAIKA